MSVKRFYSSVETPVTPSLHKVIYLQLAVRIRSDTLSSPMHSRVLSMSVPDLSFFLFCFVLLSPLLKLDVPGPESKLRAVGQGCICK